MRREGTGLAARKPVRRVPPPQLRFQRKDTEQYHVCLSAPGIARMDERRFAASILDAIVGGSASSRLFQEIREKRGMAYSVYSYASQYSDAGQIGLYVGTREENLGTCLEIAVAELADVAAGNVRPEELQRAKENLKGRLLLSLESTSNRMTRLGQGDDHRHAAARGRGDRQPPRVGDGARDRRARERAPGGGASLGSGHRPRRGALPRGRLAREPGTRRSRVKIALFGAGGKVGSVLGPALEAAGHEVVDGRSPDLDGCDRGDRLHGPGRGRHERRPVSGGERSRRHRDDRVRSCGDRPRRTRSRRSRASTPPTSRRERFS